ncbi:Uncharacterized protein PCOAH_00038390 [Plasmodium coatneyi]|uniref:Spondin domain-containing protein n=1 Tax=Plasmodium coatneyi TaxID=208452 RepID=A0A1B1E594_9APIC|nr:Uncharacterized protein PCOAH_00038390 [Plasmodium coatneyi]ANQ10202.1 Uncharacterized protein PCOAH_00038390 [Plasmodium coatneyi]
MAPFPTKFSILLTFAYLFLCCQWSQYPNHHVIPLDILYDNGTSQNAPLNIRIGRSLMGETKIQGPPQPRPKQNKFLASPKGASPRNSASDGMSKTSSTEAKSKVLILLKIKEQCRRMKIGTRKCCNKLAHAISENKEWLLPVLAILVFYPAALHCIYLFVMSYTVFLYPWKDFYITVPLFMVYVLLSVLVGKSSWWD